MGFRVTVLKWSLITEDDLDYALSRFPITEGIRPVVLTGEHQAGAFYDLVRIGPGQDVRLDRS